MRGNFTVISESNFDQLPDIMRDYRVLAGKSQRQITNEFGIRQSHCSKLENMAINPDLSIVTLLNYMEACNMRVCIMDSDRANHNTRAPKLVITQDVLDDFGNTLNGLRTEAQVTQMALQRKTGIMQCAISIYENPDSFRVPKVKSLLRYLTGIRKRLVLITMAEAYTTGR